MTGKRQKYTVEEKLNAVRRARATSVYRASKELDIDRKRIREWKEQESSLLEHDRNSYRLSGGGRKLSSNELEELLVEHILEQRLQGLRVTRMMVVQWGRELAVDDDEASSLQFSHGWLQKFLDRHDFVLRKATNKPILSDSIIVDRAARFILHVKQLIADYNIQPENIYSLDETALFFEHSDSRTLQERGSRHVQVHLLT